ncbi:hypothetical protein BDV23DRAFT_167474 [Aspergillus alliaceus]|uniref:SNF2 N-terminal domain-containing protein n=1 Tax=Petromyces alliaceus TaxID=209559 RepID=A0A5N7BR86_PETAA|nr:hypothetical protein BDV23DRAFT_167474 [Aspergillus alliaceus]
MLVIKALDRIQRIPEDTSTINIKVTEQANTAFKELLNWKPPENEHTLTWEEIVRSTLSKKGKYKYKADNKLKTDIFNPELLEFKFKSYLKGSILADSVGLGKTWETIAFMLKVSD